MIHSGRLDFKLLETAPYAVYAVDINQVLVFWNRRAEEILGYSRTDAIGRPCHEIIRNWPTADSAHLCTDCPSFRCTRVGSIPPVFQISMLCASGQRKQVTVTPVVLNADRPVETILVHILHENSMEMPEGLESCSLTRRELEVVRLLAQGLETDEVAANLVISRHTVLNHIRNARQRLGARSRATLLVEVIRRGLFEQDMDAESEATPLGIGEPLRGETRRR